MSRHWLTSWCILLGIALTGALFAQEQKIQRIPFMKDELRDQQRQGDLKKDVGGSVPASITATDVLVNNNTGFTSTSQFTQSEQDVIAFGNTVIVVFNDAGSFASGSHFTGWSRSTDGGVTFTDGGILPTSTIGDAGDPVVARNNTTGRLYFSTLGFNAPGTIQMFRSTDNGTTWMAPVNATPGGGSEDKQWHTVDNFAGSGNGNVYIISRRFGTGPGIYVFRSTDHGTTFTPSGGTLIVSGSQGAYIDVGPDHSVYAFWYAGTTLQMRKSTDFGVTFAAAVTVASGLIGGSNGDLGLTGIRQGTTTASGFRSNEFPHAAVNPVNGNIYVTYNNKGAGADKADVFFTQSTNGGTTWLAPVKVNDDVTTTDQWQPTIAFTPAGNNRLGIFYYSRQEDPTGNNLFKFYGRLGTISGATVTWAPSFAISDVASLPEFGRDAVVNSSYMGDYTHVYATLTAFRVVWSDNRDDLPGGAGRKDPNVYYESILATDNPIVTLAPAQYIEPGGSLGYKVNGTNVGTTWTGIYTPGDPPLFIESMPTAEWGFLQWNDGDTYYAKSIAPTSSVTLNAIYKGRLKTTAPSLADAKNQRRLVASSIGSWMMVYESAGDVWVTSSGDNGYTWGREERLSTNWGHALNPTISNVFTYSSNSSDDPRVVIGWLEQPAQGGAYQLHLQTMFVNGFFGSHYRYGWNSPNGERSSNNHKVLDGSPFYIPVPRSDARPGLQLDQVGNNVNLLYSYENNYSRMIAGKLNFPGNGYNSVSDLDQASVIREGLASFRTLSKNGGDSYPVIISYPPAFGYPARTCIYYLAGGYASGKRVVQYDYPSAQTSLLATLDGDYTYYSLQGATNTQSASFALVSEAYNTGGGGRTNVDYYYKPTYYGNSPPSPAIAYVDKRQPTLMLENVPVFGSATIEIDMVSTVDNYWYKDNGSAIGTGIAGILTREKVAQGDRASMLVLADGRIVRYDGSGAGDGGGVLAKAEHSGVPSSYDLHQNYPNPFNPTTEIRFDLPDAGNVSLVVYDLLGREVANLANGYREAGYHSTTWNASVQASGVYFARFNVTNVEGLPAGQAGKIAYSKVNKLMLIR